MIKKNSNFRDITNRVMGDEPRLTQNAPSAKQGFRSRSASAAGIKVELPTPASWIALASTLPNAPQTDTSSQPVRPATAYNIQNECAYMSVTEFCDLAEKHNLSAVRYYGAKRIIINGGAALQAEFIFLTAGEKTTHYPVTQRQELRKYGISGVLGKHDQILFEEQRREEIPRPYWQSHKQFKHYSVPIGYLRKIIMASDLTASAKGRSTNRVIKTSNAAPKSNARTTLDISNFLNNISLFRLSEPPFLTGMTLTYNIGQARNLTSKGLDIPLCRVFSVSAYQGPKHSVISNITLSAFEQHMRQAIQIHGHDVSGGSVIRALFGEASEIRINQDHTGKPLYILVPN